MNGPRRRRQRRLIGIFLVPPLLWTLVLTLAPTEWARQRVVKEIEAATEGPVHLGAVSFGVFGHVWLNDLSLSEPGANGDEKPWLQADSIRINLSLAKVALGYFEPSEVVVGGLRLHLHRHLDGSFALGRLLQKSPNDPKDDSTGTTDRPEPSPMNFRIRDATLILNDEPTGTRMRIEAIQAVGYWGRREAEINELHGQLNDGTIALAVDLKRGPEPAFLGEFHLQEVRLSPDLNVLCYLIPCLAGMADSLEGRMNLDLTLNGRGASADAIQDLLVGQGRIVLDPILLEESAILRQLEGLIPMPVDGRVGAIRSDFQIERRRVASQHLELEVGQFPIVLAGFTDFQGRMDYRLNLSAIAGRLTPSARDFLTDFGIEPRDVVTLRVLGTLDEPRVRVDESSADSTASRLEELARRLRDRLRR